MLYSLIFRVFFQRLDPEFAHELAVRGLKLARQLGLIKPSKPHSLVTVMGLEFDNQLGMAAGFDKNGKLVRELHALGFGHVEIGTVTPKPQHGNPKPRLFRLVNNKALINRMGFNNDGAIAIAKRINSLRSTGKPLPIIGINIGKNKDTSAELAAADYESAARILAPVADYLVVNVSSPNTAGLRDLQQVQALRPILMAVQKASEEVPVLIKIAPDLADADIEAVSNLVIELDLAGMVATNTTISRQDLVPDRNTSEAGGLSGPILNQRAVEVLALVRKVLPQHKVVISVGGVTTKSDLQQRLSMGADLVQGYTGFVYGGPGWARRLTS